MNPLGIMGNSVFRAFLVFCFCFLRFLKVGDFQNTTNFRAQGSHGVTGMLWKSFSEQVPSSFLRLQYISLEEQNM